MGTQTHLPPPQHSRKPISQYSRLRRPIQTICIVGAITLAATLVLKLLPSAEAGTLEVLTLATVLSADEAYWENTPLMGGSISLSKEYVPPKEWTGSQFSPVIVNITAGASDQDAFHRLIEGIGWTVSFFTDQITADLDGPDGYTDGTPPWLGPSGSGTYSTVNCAGQTTDYESQLITLDVSDAAPYPGTDDPDLELTKRIKVVLPNAVATSLYNHVFYSGTHVGDAWWHTFFYRPINVSPSNPTPTVNFNQYQVEEGDWRLQDVDESDGLDKDEVQKWFDGESGEWDSVWTLNSNNRISIVDSNRVFRWDASLQYGLSFREKGEIILRQGFRVVSPNQGPWIYINLKLHFTDKLTAPGSQGQCHVLKESYLTTSTDKEWKKCGYCGSLCPYQ